MSIMHNADRTRTHNRGGNWLVMQSMQPPIGGFLMPDAWKARIIDRLHVMQGQIKVLRADFEFLKEQIADLEARIK